MKLVNIAGTLWSAVKKRPVRSGAAALAVLALGWMLLAPGKNKGPLYSFHEVKRGDFLISIVEGGTIEAVNEEVVRSEVEGTARIVYIVPEGSSVKQGDLVVELDSSLAQDAVNLQQIAVEKAQFALIQAEQQLEIGKSTVESEVQAATLKVEFAQSDFDKYVKGEALQTRRNAQIEITNTMENLQIAEERLEWTEKLHAKGFETKGNLDKDRLAVSQGRLKLEQTTKALWMIETFDEPKKKRELEAALQEAKENLERVRLQGDRKVAQYKADVDTQRITLELSKRKFDRDQRNFEACKIHAPQDGLVVYAGGGNRFSSESLIEEGAVVRFRQELIKLPDVSAMKLQVKIHESHINQVEPGQPTWVVLDSEPDNRYQGAVRRVAPLPDSSSRWGNPNLKVYATEIVITDPMPDVKPGVSARAEIVITNLPDVVTVPIQAVTTRKGKQVVFFDTAPTKAVPVEVGQYNTRFIQIVSGVNPGQRVMLSPPLDPDEQDLAGAIIGNGGDLPQVDSNKLARLTAPVPHHTNTPARHPWESLGKSLRPERDRPADATGARSGGSRERGITPAGPTSARPAPTANRPPAK